MANSTSTTEVSLNLTTHTCVTSSDKKFKFRQTFQNIICSCVYKLREMPIRPALYTNNTFFFPIQIIFPFESNHFLFRIVSYKYQIVGFESNHDLF